MDVLVSTIGPMTLKSTFKRAISGPPTEKGPPSPYSLHTSRGHFPSTGSLVILLSWTQYLAIITSPTFTLFIDNSAKTLVVIDDLLSRLQQTDQHQTTQYSSRAAGNAGRAFLNDLGEGYLSA